MTADHKSHGLTHDVSRPIPRETIADLSGRPLLSNVGIPLDLQWIENVRANTSAVERRAQSHVARRTVKKEWQAAWLLRAISCMDLTTLSGDDTDERVRRLCAKARYPIRQDLVEPVDRPARDGGHAEDRGQELPVHLGRLDLAGGKGLGNGIALRFGAACQHNF